jgi:hypothetical protein
MELSELKNRIINLHSGTEGDLARLLQLVEEDQAIYPFNEYEHLICGMLGNSSMTYYEYIELRSEYVSANPHLWIFEISAPRGFGESFAQTYVMGMCKDLKKPSKALDPAYSGQYDLWLDGIRIEVKASRAVDKNSAEPLYMKALSKNTTNPFLMNYQQLKPQMCDVFIWVAVFRDEIVLWILNSREVANHELYSKGQHRGNKGNEGQLHMKDDNISLFDQFQLTGDNLKQAIVDASKRP